jgi:hypothetical protein
MSHCPGSCRPAPFAILIFQFSMLPRLGKQIVPAQPCGQTGTKGGWEHATLSFPVPALGAWWLPASRRYSPRPAEFVRPRSRAVQRLARAEFRVRPLGSLGLAVAPPARKPGQDTPVISFPRLDHLAPGRPPLLAVRWPGATGLTSYLSGCLSLTSQRCVLHIAGVPEVLRAGLARVSSRKRRLSLSAFRRFCFGGSETARALRSVLAHSSNHVPFG